MGGGVSEPSKPPRAPTSPRIEGREGTGGVGGDPSTTSLPSHPPPSADPVAGGRPGALESRHPTRTLTGSPRPGAPRGGGGAGAGLCSGGQARGGGGLSQGGGAEEGGPGRSLGAGSAARGPRLVPLPPAAGAAFRGARRCSEPRFLHVGNGGIGGHGQGCCKGSNEIRGGRHSKLLSAVARDSLQS